MKKNRTIFVLATRDYEPELCEITFPYLKKFADKIKADLYRIETRKFPEFPITYERMQIHELGKGNEWTLCIDPDMLVHPDTTDFTTWFPKDHVGNWYFFDTRQFFNVDHDPYFKNDGRFYGIVDSLVVTSDQTHDLWRPLEGTFASYEPLIYDKNCLVRISEFAISQNLARFGYKVRGVVDQGKRLFHICCSSDKVNNPADRALKKLSEWGFR
jgi:hypothetical protein